MLVRRTRDDWLVASGTRQRAVARAYAGRFFAKVLVEIAADDCDAVLRRVCRCEVEKVGELRQLLLERGLDDSGMKGALAVRKIARS